MKKSILSALLALCMALTLLPGNAWAEEGDMSSPASSPQLELVSDYDNCGRPYCLAMYGGSAPVVRLRAYVAQKEEGRNFAFADQTVEAQNWIIKYDGQELKNYSVGKSSADSGMAEITLENITPENGKTLSIQALSSAFDGEDIPDSTEITYTFTDVPVLPVNIDFVRPADGSVPNELAWEMPEGASLPETITVWVESTNQTPHFYFHAYQVPSSLCVQNGNTYIVDLNKCSNDLVDGSWESGEKADGLYNISIRYSEAGKAEYAFASNQVMLTNTGSSGETPSGDFSITYRDSSTNTAGEACAVIISDIAFPVQNTRWSFYQPDFQQPEDMIRIKSVTYNQDTSSDLFHKAAYITFENIPDAGCTVSVRAVITVPDGTEELYSNVCTVPIMNTTPLANLVSFLYEDGVSGGTPPVGMAWQLPAADYIAAPTSFSVLVRDDISAYGHNLFSQDVTLGSEELSVESTETGYQIYTYSFPAGWSDNLPEGSYYPCVIWRNETWYRDGLGHYSENTWQKTAPIVSDPVAPPTVSDPVMPPVIDIPFTPDVFDVTTPVPTPTAPTESTEPEALVEPETPAEPEQPVNPAPVFTDVAPAAWYSEAASYVSVNGLMTGISAAEFSPDTNMTRAMLWTVLGRMDGADVEGAGNNWYAKAQSWIVGKGISDGQNAGANITREELVTMLWRYAGSPDGAADLSGFTDGAGVSGWAAQAMEWAVSAGLLKGDGGRLNPAGTATRAEVAAILMRFCETR